MFWFKRINMFLKSFLLTSVILLSYLVFFGQTSFPYDQEWKMIDSLMNKKNLALLFDMIKMQQALKPAHSKLQQIQSEGREFPWFKGGRDDQYITQYIISGIGRLKKLKAIPADLQVPLDKMVISAIDFLDQEISRDYEKRDKSKDAQNLNSSQIQYLYMRSFFSEISSSPNANNANNYYKKLSIEKWMKQSVYMQCMIALYLNRTGEIKTSKDIQASLKENATDSKELGLFLEICS